MHHQDTASPDVSPERLVAERYRLLSPLGEGGMGTVWRARDEVLRREVAIKEVRAPSGLAAEKIERMYTRLEREAWAAARITARNVITVHDVVTDGGRPWIVMELVRGRSLADLLEEQGTLRPQEAARIGAEVLNALRAAHEADVLHRDVKPANVLLADDDRVILSDFGIAMVMGDTALTMTGEVVGSPEYLAPEQALGRSLGPATDLWSLGVLLHTAVQGRSPFRQDSALGTLRAVVDDEPPVADRAGPLAPVIEGLLRKDPAERASAERTARDLRLIAAGAALDADSTSTGPQPVATAADAPTGQAHPAPRPASADTAQTGTAAATVFERPGDARPAPDATGATDATSADTSALTSADTSAVTAVDGPTAPARPAATAPAAPDATSPDATSPATASHDLTVADGTVAATAAPGATDTPTVQVRTSPGPTGAGAPPAPPTGPAHQQVPQAHSLPTATSPVTAEAPGSTPPPRNRRKGYLIVALATVGALLLGGLGYALLNEGDDGKADAKDPSSNTAGTGSPQAQDGAAAGGDGSDAEGQPPVTVTVEGTNTTYAGSCPPPQDRAPAFTATFKVTELPVSFTYRWVSAEGSVVDRTWRRLTFSEGGPRTHQQSIRVTTYAQEGTLASAMGVEIKSSQQTISDTVPFTVTCR
ncbi:serine/threonine-protein kinase [Streptomyces apricus]|uniref:non-specific serine/threonine protein kinase n=1 Tax=Streptomyces apricus TaxID=1828112 RepID=A0A5B0ARA4_9ACTN|nr:serine/threonine-protein kinase [Streptomyces apricus]KAA0931846.1 serine/threonine protein kinase [Streptomyces apricus]